MDPARRRRGAWLAAGALLLLAAGVGVALAIGSLSSSRSHETPGVPPGATTVPTSPPTTPGPPSRSAVSGEQFGMSVNRLFENPAFSASQISTQLSQLRATGATLARTDALWEASEPQAPVEGRHRFDWTFDDRIATALAEHGLRWLPIIDYTVGWAQSIPGADHSPPRSLSAYAQYAAAFAARYGPGGGFWAAHTNLPAEPVETIEVWNEPDNPAFWTPRPNLGVYADMYVLARDAIAHAAPQVRVIVGGLFQPLRSLPALLAARPDLAGHLDGVAIHPYGDTPAAVLSEVAEARAALRRLGLGSTPLYITEYGWTTSPAGAHNYLPERLRPAYLELTTAGLGHTGCGVAEALAYTWVTEEQDPSNSEQWFGINPPSAIPGPDTRAYTRGLAAARAPRPAGSCAGG
jgi:polysaccharide biosynthesis protein PslG